MIRSLREKPLFWLTIGFSGVVLWVVLWWEPVVRNGALSDRHIRMLGMFLQLIGAATVGWDLTRTARDMGLHLSWEKVGAYFKSIVVTPPAATNEMSAHLRSHGSMTIARFGSLPDPSQPLERRVAELERISQELEGSIATVQDELYRKAGELHTNLQRSAAELRNEIRQSKGQFERAFIGNFYVLWFGLAWLMVGVVVASIPSELMCFSQWLGWHSRV